MELLTLLNQNERILLEDLVEDKKTRALIDVINRELVDIIDDMKNFNDFATSQLQGEYNRKLVMAKSLMNYYGNWTAMINVISKMEKEEADLVKAFYARKEKLLNNVKTLLKDSQKNPVVCAYDVFDGDYVPCQIGHYVVVLGENNTGILQSMIADLDIGLQVQGNYANVEAKELNCNYYAVDENVALCNRKLEELYAGKAGKADKLKQAIAHFEEEGRKAAFFQTYVGILADLGVTKKEIAAYEKYLAKCYLPYKNQLRKAFKVNFLEVAESIQIKNEEAYGSADDEGFVDASQDETFGNMNVQTFNRKEVTFEGKPFAQPQNEQQYAQEEVYEEEGYAQQPQVQFEEVEEDFEEDYE